MKFKTNFTGIENFLLNIFAAKQKEWEEKYNKTKSEFDLYVATTTSTKKFNERYSTLRTQRDKLLLENNELRKACRSSKYNFNHLNSLKIDFLNSVIIDRPPTKYTHFLRSIYEHIKYVYLYLL